MKKRSKEMRQKRVVSSRTRPAPALLDVVCFVVTRSPGVVHVEKTTARAHPAQSSTLFATCENASVACSTRKVLNFLHHPAPPNHPHNPQARTREKTSCTRGKSCPAGGSCLRGSSCAAGPQPMVFLASSADGVRPLARLSFIRCSGSPAAPGAAPARSPPNTATWADCVLMRKMRCCSSWFSLSS